MKRFWPLPFGVLAALAIWAGCQTGHMAPPPPIVALPSNSLQPTADEEKTAYYVARLMEEFQYLQHPLDKQMSAKFFDGYIDSLDSRHELFLQSDLAEFAPFRTNLDTLTINRSLSADLSPAFLIYHRFQERLEQRAAYVNELLAADKFKFNSDDKIETDRRHAPFPKDLTEAEQLWREGLRYEYLSEKLQKELLETNGVVKVNPEAATNIVADLEKHYRWTLHMMTNQDSDTVLQVYLNALTHAYDPHSDYYSPPHAQDFSISMNLALFGIGAQLTEDNGYCTIHSLVPGGPASKSKMINEKDRIVAVGQGTNTPTDVVDMDLEKIVQQIRGPKGTEVQIVVSQWPDFTKRVTVPLVRDEIKLEDSQTKGKIIDLPDGHGGTSRIGVLEVPSFYAPVPGSGDRATPRYVSVDTAALLKKFMAEHVAGVIVDMRSNPGGSLEEAVKFTGLFIKGGPVVQARDSDGRTGTDSVPDPNQVYSGPLVVMINRFSASASEIAAAALQDYGRAVIVGDISTHGKGTVQQLDQLQSYLPGLTNDPGELKVTIRKFYRITGASTQLKGVTPDIILPDVYSYLKDAGESNLDNPLAWDTISPSQYDKMNLVAPYISDLRTHSDTRVQTNTDFTYIRQDIEQLQKLQSDRTTTLNERELIKERERDAARNNARNEEREKRKDPGIRIYDLTVDSAGQPGLPAPVDWLGQTNGVPATGTNSAAEAKKIPAVDPMLDESERILEDYISLMQKGGNLTSIP